MCGVFATIVLIQTGKENKEYYSLFLSYINLSDVFFIVGRLAVETPLQLTPYSRTSVEAARELKTIARVFFHKF